MVVILTLLGLGLMFIVGLLLAHCYRKLKTVGELETKLALVQTRCDALSHDLARQETLVAEVVRDLRRRQRLEMNEVVRNMSQRSLGNQIVDHLMRPPSLTAKISPPTAGEPLTPQTRWDLLQDD